MQLGASACMRDSHAMAVNCTAVFSFIKQAGCSEGSYIDAFPGSLFLLCRVGAAVDAEHTSGAREGGQSGLQLRQSGWCCTDSEDFGSARM